MAIFVWRQTSMEVISRGRRRLTRCGDAFGRYFRGFRQIHCRDATQMSAPAFAELQYDGTSIVDAMFAMSAGRAGENMAIGMTGRNGEPPMKRNIIKPASTSKYLRQVESISQQLSTPRSRNPSSLALRYRRGYHRRHQSNVQQ